MWGMIAAATHLFAFLANHAGVCVERNVAPRFRVPVAEVFALSHDVILSYRICLAAALDLNNYLRHYLYRIWIQSSQSLNLIIMPFPLTDNVETSPEDIMYTSLETLYDFAPVMHSSAGSLFTYTRPASLDSPPEAAHAPLTISLSTPDTRAENWSLHASTIWVASLYIADHLEDLHLNQHDPSSTSTRPIRVLELGAGAGLPSILISKSYAHVEVTSSDYPDAELIRTLEDNVKRNQVADRCRAVPFAWGSDPALLAPKHDSQFALGEDSPLACGFDVIVAADTLWNSEAHHLLIDTLSRTLSRTEHARVHLVAGLHTGRYTIQTFLNSAETAGFQIQEAIEREVKGDGRRVWQVERAEGEDERERRRWVVWIILKWNGHT